MQRCPKCESREGMDWSAILLAFAFCISLLSVLLIMCQKMIGLYIGWLGLEHSCSLVQVAFGMVSEGARIKRNTGMRTLRLASA